MIDIITPTLWRGDRLAGYVANIHEATETEHVVTFVAEADDQATLDAIGEIQGIDGSVRIVINQRTKSCHGAFNTGVAASTAPFWFASGDDVVFTPGWDTLCLDLMDDETWVVGTNDLRNPNVLAGWTATHFLVDRRFSDSIGGTFDETPGIVAFEGYGHDFFDTELCEVATRHGRWKPCLEAIVEHKHWVWHTASWDDTYVRNRDMCLNDPEKFKTRQAAYRERHAA